MVLIRKLMVSRQGLAVYKWIRASGFSNKNLCQSPRGCHLSWAGIVLTTLTFDVFNCPAQLLHPPIKTIANTMQVSAKTSRLECGIRSLLDLVIVYPTEP